MFRFVSGGQTYFLVVYTSVYPSPLSGKSVPARMRK